MFTAALWLALRQGLPLMDEGSASGHGLHAVSDDAVYEGTALSDVAPGVRLADLRGRRVSRADFRPVG